MKKNRERWFFLAAFLLMGSHLAAYNPNPCGCWYVTAEALYFEPEENGLAYGIVERGRFPVSIQSPTSTGLERNFTSDATIKSPKFHYDTGFRIQLGYQPPCTPWNLSVKWSHFCSDAESSLSIAGLDSLFVGTWSRESMLFIEDFLEPFDILGIIFVTPLTHEQVAKADLSFHFNSVDIDTYYPLCLNSCFSLIPRLGVRIACIDQKYRLSNTFFGKREEDDLGSLFLVDLSVDENIHLKNDFFGAGINAGLDLEYCFGCGFSLYGTCNGSLLRGKFDVDQDYIAAMTTISTSELSGDSAKSEKEITYHQSNDTRLTRAVLDLGIGFRYTKYLCGCCLPLTLQFGWEQHQYFEQNQLQPFDFSLFDGRLGSRNSNRGDLSLQGWTFGAKLEF